MAAPGNLAPTNQTPPEVKPYGSPSADKPKKRKGTLKIWPEPLSIFDHRVDPEEAAGHLGLQKREPPPVLGSSEGLQAWLKQIKRS